MNEFLSAKCVTDFWYHIRYGAYFSAMQHYYGPLHGPEGIAGFLQNWTHKDPDTGAKTPTKIKALVVAREHCKTQLGSIGWAAWQYARDPDLRILVRAATNPKAEEIGGSIRQLLDSPRYRTRYPWVQPARKTNGMAEEWRNDKFRLARTAVAVRVSSMDALGADADPTGGHYDRSIYDDWEVKTNVLTLDARNKLIETLRSDRSLMLGGSQTLFVGTPWHPECLVGPAMHKKSIWAEMHYELLVAACQEKIFAAPFEGARPVLDGDRQTLRDSNAGFPTIEANLKLCQATIYFVHPSTGDAHAEIREVESNTGSTFRVNRPLPEMLGQPLSYTIGTDKPTSPNRFTLDSTDLDPSVGHVNNYAVELNGERPLVRSSLPGKKKELGSREYSAQWLLKPVDEEEVILNPDDLRRCNTADVPPGLRSWFRSCDFATGKKTQAATAITTGFYHENGNLYIARIAYRNNMDILEKMAELCWGQAWVHDQGAKLKWTSIESTSNIEATLSEQIDSVTKDPYAYFNNLRTKCKLFNCTYQAFAERFKPGEEVKIKMRVLPRLQTSKTLRVAGQQPFWETNRLYILNECEHFDVLCDHARDFRMDSTEGLDLLETIEDLRCYGVVPVVSKPKAKGKDDYRAYMNKMKRRNRLARIG